MTSLSCPIIRAKLCCYCYILRIQEEIATLPVYNSQLTETGLRYNLCFPDDGNDIAITLSAKIKLTKINYYLNIQF